MSVDAFRNVTAGMTEDAALGCLVRAGIIQQRRYCMSAVMRSMAVSADEMHDRPPDGAVPPIVVWLAHIIADEGITWAFHAGLDERSDAVMYRDNADTGSCFAVRDIDVPLTQVHVCLLQG